MKENKDIYSLYGLFRLDPKKVSAELIAKMETSIKNQVAELEDRWTDEYRTMRDSGDYDYAWLKDQHEKDMAFLPAMARSFQQAFLAKHKLLNYQQ